MENVARLYTRLNGQTREEIKQHFEALGYVVEARIVCASEYGVPQNRYRVLFIGKLTDNFMYQVHFPEKVEGEPPTIILYFKVARHRMCQIMKPWFILHKCWKRCHT